MKKIKYISNIPVPYVSAMLNEIGKYCSLEAIFEAETYVNHNKKFYDGEHANFHYICLKKGNIEEKKPNFQILKYINNKQDMLIMTTYSDATGALALLAAKIRKIPYYWEIDGAVLHEESILKHLIKKMLIRGAKGYISSGKTGDDYLIHYGAKKENIYRYHFSSLHETDILKQTVTEEQKQILKKSLGLSSKPLIISVGRYVYIDRNGNESTKDAKKQVGNGAKLIKGFDILIKAFSEFKDKYQLVIIGGKPNSEISSLVKDLNIDSVKFVDFMDKNHVFKYYQAADLFCLQSRGDSWGLVINEAMANGLPVITTTKCVAGLNLIENGVNGYLVEPEDWHTLSKKIDLILSNNRLRNKMAENNIRKIQPYNIENMALTHISLLNNDYKSV